MNRDHMPLLPPSRDSVSTGTLTLCDISEKSTDGSVFTELDFLERQSNLTERQSRMDLNQSLLHESDPPFSSIREDVVVAVFALFGVLLIAFIVLLGSDLL